MNHTTLSCFIVSAFVALTGCNSSSISADTDLPLDFTLSLADLGADADTLVGATFNNERDEFTILDKQGTLLYLSTDGVLTDETNIETEAILTGIEFISDGHYVISTESSQILLFDEQASTLEQLSQLDFDINAIAYDEASSSVVVIDDGFPSRIVSIALSGEMHAVTMKSHVTDNSVTGLTTTDDGLVIASVDPINERTVIITAGFNGEIGPVWSIQTDMTTGLVVIDSEAPEVVTTNSDPDLSITVFQALSGPSEVNGDALTLSSSVELKFNQPSGIDFTSENANLSFVTDFGEVRRGSTDGDNDLLFKIDSLQGRFEAIVHHITTNTFALMMSDEDSEDSTIITFDGQGNQIATIPVPVIDPEHQFDSLDYHIESDTYVTVTATEGPKVLYSIFSDGSAETTALSGEYDDFVIGGIAITENGRHLYMVTEEWEDENEILNAGYLIKIDLDTNSELARYAIGIEVDGEMQGVRDPSDVAIDEANNLIFITSDIDDAMMLTYINPVMD